MSDTLQSDGGRVAVELPVAGLGSRAMAWLVDSALLFGVALIAYFGVTFFVMIPPQDERQPAAGGGSFQLPNDKGRQAPIGTVTGYTTTPESQNGPLATLPHENGFGIVLAIVPSISGHFDF